LYSISVWNDIKKSPTEEKLKHPAIFPSSLAKRLIEVLSHQEDIILDPFMGTGSTLVAAQELGRSSVGIDISDDFANIARVRFRKRVDFDADSHHLINNSGFCRKYRTNTLQTIQ
jgi:DNA modification methylase